MDSTEDEWLNRVTELLGVDGAPVGADTKRLLLRVTKATADATGIRYLAPLTAYLIGVAEGRLGESFDLAEAAREINALAAGWDRPPGD